MSARTRLVAACVAVGALVAGACGGDDGAETATSVDQGIKEGIESQLGGSATTAAGQEEAEPHPTSMEEWEALWAEERAAMVARITANGWGKSADGTKLTGPEGYEVDLTACPAEWSDTEGVTDTEIKLGWPSVMSGPQGDFAGWPLGGRAVLEHYSKQGYFVDSTGKTRNVVVEVRDDGYDTAKTLPLIDELIDSVRVLGTATGISPGGLNSYDKTNARCIPQFIHTGHPAWGDPVNHPWTTQMILSYSTEAVLWGAFIEQNLDEWGGKAKVAGLVMSNDFGRAYDEALRAYFEQSPRAADIEYVTEGLEPAAPTIKDQMTTLAAQQPDVFIAMTTGTSCTQAITEAAENGLKDTAKALFQPSVCKSSSFIGKDKVGGDGSLADGWWIVGGGLKDFNAEAFDDDPWVAWARDVLAEAGYDYRTSANYTQGVHLGWQLAQALKVAGELPGGVSRTNFNIALRTMDMTNPALVEGVRFNLNGNADAYIIEGSDLSQWNSEKQVWEVRQIVELSGKSRNCAWDPSAGVCR